MLVRQVIGRVQVFVIQEIQQAGDRKQPGRIDADKIADQQGNRRAECPQKKSDQNRRKQDDFEIPKAIDRHRGVGKKTMVLLRMPLENQAEARTRFMHHESMPEIFRQIRIQKRDRDCPPFPSLNGVQLHHA